MFGNSLDIVPTHPRNTQTSVLCALTHCIDWVTPQVSSPPPLYSIFISYSSWSNIRKPETWLSLSWKEAHYFKYTFTKKPQGAHLPYIWDLSFQLWLKSKSLSTNLPQGSIHHRTTRGQSTHFQHGEEPVTGYGHSTGLVGTWQGGGKLIIKSFCANQVSSVNQSQLRSLT